MSKRYITKTTVKKKKKKIVGHLFRNMHPSITIYLSLSFTRLYIIIVLQGISYLTTEAEQGPIFYIS